MKTVSRMKMWFVSVLVCMLVGVVPAAGQFTINYGNGMITGYSGLGGEVTLPRMVDTIWVRSIGPSVFANDTSLTQLLISDSSFLTVIGASAFKGCASLTQIRLPEYWTAGTGIRTIADSAFAGCTSLWLVELPATLNSLGIRAFAGCNMNRISIPGGVATISEEAFMGCTSLTDVLIYNGVNTIGQSAFEGCTSLATVIIGAGVSKVGDMAFSGCTSLDAVHCESVTPPTIDTSSQVFDSVSLASATLYVPTLATKAAYMVAAGWKDFGTILAEGEVPIPTEGEAVRVGLIVHESNVTEYDTTMLIVGDTVIEHEEVVVTTIVEVNDTTYVPPTARDTVWITDEVHDTFRIVLRDTVWTWDTLIVTEWHYDTVRITAHDTVVKTQEVRDTVKINVPYDVVTVINGKTGAEYAVGGDLKIVSYEDREDVYFIRGLVTGTSFAVYDSTGTLIYYGSTQPVRLTGSGLFVVEQSGQWWKFVK